MGHARIEHVALALSHARSQNHSPTPSRPLGIELVRSDSVDLDARTHDTVTYMSPRNIFAESQQSLRSGDIIISPHSINDEARSSSPARRSPSVMDDPHYTSEEDKLN